MNFAKVFVQISVGVWLGIGEVNLVIVMLKSVSESESIVASLEVCDLVLIFLVIVLEIAQVFSPSCPSLLKLEILLACTVAGPSFLDPLLSLFGVNEDFHSLVVETFGLDHVKHIELDFHSFFNIGNSEKEPLSMSFRVNIIL